MSLLASTSKAVLTNPRRACRSVILLEASTRRDYATLDKKPQAPMKQGFRGNSKKRMQGQGQEGEAGKKEKYPGAFRPLAANQLSHPLLQIAVGDKGLQLPVLSAESLKHRKPGKVLAYPMSGNTAMEIFGLPKNLLLEFRLLSKPCSVVRDVTVQALNELDAASEKSSIDTRIVLSGDPGCGKSHLLLQAVEYCISKGWIVLYIPRATNLVNSTTPYTYDLRTQTYLQPGFAQQSLQRMLACNSHALSALKTQEHQILDRFNSVHVGTPLSELIGVGLKEQALAPTVLSTLLSELGTQNTTPVLLAIDDFQALYCPTLYRDAHFQYIRPFHLSMPRLLMEYASGKKTFARGAVLGATSTSHTTFTMPLELREALGLPHDRPSGPYAKRSTLLAEYCAGLRSLPVPGGMSVKEAAALFETWMEDRALHSLPNDELFLSKYSEASGNPRKFLWGGLFSTLTT